MDAEENVILCTAANVIRKSPHSIILLYFSLFLFNISGMWKQLYEHVEIRTQQLPPPPYFANQIEFKNSDILISVYK